MRGAKLHRFFWEQVADHLNMSAIEYPTRDREVAVSGLVGGLRVNVGAWSSGGEAPEERTVVSVEVEGLPVGLEVDGLGSVSFSGIVEHVVCGDGRTRKVSVIAVPVQLGGLRLEQAPFDLVEWLTPARRESICALRNDLYFLKGRHYVRSELKGLPYPPRKILTRSMSGDPAAVQDVWSESTKTAEHVREVVKDARAVMESLAGGSTMSWPSDI